MRKGLDRSERGRTLREIGLFKNAANLSLILPHTIPADLSSLQAEAFPGRFGIPFTGEIKFEFIPRSHQLGKLYCNTSPRPHQLQTLAANQPPPSERRSPNRISHRLMVAAVYDRSKNAGYQLLK